MEERERRGGEGRRKGKGGEVRRKGRKGEGRGGEGRGREGRTGWDGKGDSGNIDCQLFKTQRMFWPHRPSLACQPLLSTLLLLCNRGG